MMPQDVVEGLKTVEKYSIKKEPSTNAVNKSSCKVFPLSLSEIYSQKALSNYFEEDSQLETIKSTEPSSLSFPDIKFSPAFASISS